MSAVDDGSDEESRWCLSRGDPHVVSNRLKSLRMIEMSDWSSDISQSVADCRSCGVKMKALWSRVVHVIGYHIGTMC